MDPPSAPVGRILLVGPQTDGPELELVRNVDSWVCDSRPSPAGVLRLLRNTGVADLLLLVPDADLHSYAELCRAVKLDARTSFVSVVFLVPSDTHSQARREDYRAEIYAAGADDCIELPASPNEILLRLSNALRAKRATDSLDDATAVLASLANAIEGRDAYTRGHVERVSTYCVELGKRLGCNAEELAALRIGGIVHDIGKIAVPDYILNKPGRLTPEEMAVVRRHPVVGFDVLRPLRTFANVRPLVRWHHERPNGTGYPDGLRGDELPLLPRIVAVADFFDAISTDRPYRPAFGPDQCRQIVSEAAEQGQLDESVVSVLLGMLDESALVAWGPPGGVVAAQQRP